MKKDKRFFIVSIILIFVLIVIEFYYYSTYSQREEPVFQISLIVYGNNPDRWENLKQGAERAADGIAAEGTTAEVNLITMSSESDAMEQIALIDREITNGADALMIAACDSKAVEQYFAQTKVNIPVIFVQNGLENQNGYPCITADNYVMGTELSKVIIENEKSWIKAAIISDGMERKSVSDRFQGVYDSLSEYVDEVVIWERDENEKNSQTMLFLQRELTEEAVDVVIALDNSSIEALLDAVANLEKEIKIYGIANSDKAVYYLDNKEIKTLIYQNEFSIGYLGVEAILDESTHAENHTADMVEYEIIDKSNMYSEEYQKLLFPFVK